MFPVDGSMLAPQLTQEQDLQAALAAAGGGTGPSHPVEANSSLYSFARNNQLSSGIVSKIVCQIEFYCAHLDGILQTAFFTSLPRLCIAIATEISEHAP